jgi:hypothetical protein
MTARLVCELLAVVRSVHAPTWSELTALLQVKTALDRILPSPRKHEQEEARQASSVDERDWRRIPMVEGD